MIKIIRNDYLEMKYEKHLRNMTDNICLDWINYHGKIFLRNFAIRFY